MFNRMCASKLSYYTPEKLAELAEAFKTDPAKMELGNMLTVVMKFFSDGIVEEFTHIMLDSKVPENVIEKSLTDLAANIIVTKDELNDVLSEMADGREEGELEVLILIQLLAERLDRFRVNEQKRDQPKFTLVVDNTKK